MRPAGDIYEHNQRRFRSPDIYEASHILFAAPAGGPQGLRAGPRRGRSRAHRIARAPGAVRRTRAGAFALSVGGAGRQSRPDHRGQTTPEFEQALFALAPGQLCESAGRHALRLPHHPARPQARGRTLPYELVADRIADYLRESVRRRADAQYIARLVSAAQIEGIELAGADALRVH